MGPGVPDKVDFDMPPTEKWKLNHPHLDITNANTKSFNSYIFKQKFKNKF